LQSMLAKEAVKQDELSTSMRNFWINQVDKYEGKGYWASFLESLQKPNQTGSVAAQSGELATLKHKAEELQAHARELEEQSHHVHGHVTWIDIGHLGLELALVFCAVAVLTKQRTFWLTGMVFAAVGAGASAWGMLGWRMMGT
jgi:Domain of unknown function (DUF4337)